MDRTFYGLLYTAQVKSLSCVGLDPALGLFPTHLKEKYRYVDLSADRKNLAAYLEFRRSGRAYDMISSFNGSMIDATQDLVCSFKMNWAQYLQYGEAGYAALKKTITHIRLYAPHAVVILDAKPGDGDKTNKSYASAAFDELGADAVTANPYMGGYDTFAPFLERKDKGIIFLCKTSNPDSGTFQDLKVNGGEKLYMKVARNVMKWNRHNNCGLVVGATYPTALVHIRNLIGDDMPILCPGVGRQGGDPTKAVRAAKNSRGMGVIISSSDDITYASSGEDFAVKARNKVLYLNGENAQGLTVLRRRLSAGAME